MRRGQIVNTSSSGGRTVAQVWSELFAANEVAFSKGKLKAVLTDDQITAALLAAFPERWESAIFRQVQKVRNRYNRGVLSGQHKIKPESPSRRYVRDARGVRPS